MTDKEMLEILEDEMKEEGVYPYDRKITEMTVEQWKMLAKLLASSVKLSDRISKIFTDKK